MPFTTSIRPLPAIARMPRTSSCICVSPRLLLYRAFLHQLSVRLSPTVAYRAYSQQLLFCLSTTVNLQSIFATSFVLSQPYCCSTENLRNSLHLVSALLLPTQHLRNRFRFVLALLLLYRASSQQLLSVASLSLRRRLWQHSQHATRAPSWQLPMPWR